MPQSLTEVLAFELWIRVPVGRELKRVPLDIPTDHIIGFALDTRSRWKGIETNTKLSESATAVTALDTRSRWKGIETFQAYRLTYPI